MQVSNQNDVKIYNLSSGRSLPEWLSERKRRKLIKKNVDLRHHIRLLHDFNMPAVSTSIKISNDKQYIFATGTYKPRVKCFDVNNLALKFERCFDSEVTAFQILSDDYSKLVFLHCDRYIEFHTASGKYYRLRMPRFGRDIAYHYPTCNSFIVGDSAEIYRLHLERGQFLQSFQSESSAVNKCCINDVHYLVAVGTQDGNVEAWDPRTKNKVGTLNCKLDCIDTNNFNDFQNQQLYGDTTNLHLLESALSNVAVTSLEFQGALTMAVGTSTGKILLYDIRSNKPFLVKDHMNGFPIKNLAFHDTMDLVYSMDKSIVKIWNKNTGKLYTSIQASEQADFNDMCTIPKTGMFFFANESPQMSTYYIPSLGPAPKWASVIDNLTEELEETNYESVYDNYKFVTEKELTELGLSHLSGTSLLRAYMHGYFIDAKLWSKAKQIVQPFSFDAYKKNMIREKIKQNRASKLMKIQQEQQEVIDKLPKINRELAVKYQQQIARKANNTKNVDEKQNLLHDDRFKALFTNPDFQINQNDEEFNRHMMGKIAVTKKLNKLNNGKKMNEHLASDDSDYEDNNYLSAYDNGPKQSDDELFDNDDDVHDSNEHKPSFHKQFNSRQRSNIKKDNHRFKFEKTLTNKQSKRAYDDDQTVNNKNEEYGNERKYMKKRCRETLGERLKSSEMKGIRNDTHNSSRGNKEFTFTVSTKKQRFKRK
ncbi:nucleolar protein 10 [Chelonus insularis]|uniref:nucleolar protein 10 n=1 Tax=Chelonus insularis TaxID=460826 RepID=UPI00158AEBC4|nr:nucleolar protein 10 [Chelonus insularis]XP_034945329.1 nucleolar protein 10 [Chelonus insularis]